MSDENARSTDFSSSKERTATCSDGTLFQWLMEASRLGVRIVSIHDPKSGHVAAYPFLTSGIPASELDASMFQSPRLLLGFGIPIPLIGDPANWEVRDVTCDPDAVREADIRLDNLAHPVTTRAASVRIPVEDIISAVPWLEDALKTDDERGYVAWEILQADDEIDPTSRTYQSVMESLANLYGMDDPELVWEGVGGRDGGVDRDTGEAR
jgi:hypothetical protein